MIQSQVVMLVIASRGEGYDGFITSYWIPLMHYIEQHSLPVHVRLLFGKESNLSGLPLTENMYLRYNTEESIIPGILQKTLLAFNWILANVAFKHVIRTNLSSIFDIRKLLMISSDLPDEMLYAGVKLPIDAKTYFVSGAGFWLTRDVCQLLVSNSARLRYHLNDDVEIGTLLSRMPGVRYRSLLDRVDVCTDARRDGRLESLVEKDFYHIRLKTADRTKDAELAGRLAKHIFGMRSTSAAVPVGPSVITQSAIQEHMQEFRDFTHAIILGKGPTFRTIRGKTPNTIVVCVNDTILHVDHCDIFVANDLETIQRIPTKYLNACRLLLLPLHPHQNGRATKDVTYAKLSTYHKNLHTPIVVYNLKTAAALKDSWDPTFIDLSTAFNSAHNAFEFVAKHLPWLTHVQFYGVAVSTSNNTGYHPLFSDLAMPNTSEHYRKQIGQSQTNIEAISKHYQISYSLK